MSLGQEMAAARIAALEGERTRLRGQVEELSRAVEAAQGTIRKLEHQLEQLLRRLFGRRSEKLDPRQLLLDEIIPALEAAPPARPEVPAAGPVMSRPRTRPVRGHGRLPIPAHLERVEVEVEVPEAERTCPVTGLPMECIGYETSEKLEYAPGRLFVKVYKRPKYVSPKRNNGVTGVVTAAMPDHPISRCKADVGLLAWVVVNKYADHLPLYRQERIFAREGVVIPRTTQDGWLLSIACAMDPLHEALKRAVLERDILFTDDSVIPLIEDGRGRTRQARLWVYVGGGSGPPLVIYDFTVDRRKERPIEFLRGWKGYAHADAYSGYDELFRTPGVIEVGCWAHGRRGFVEAIDSRPREASEMVARIRGLYAIEKEVRNAGAETRLAARQAHAVPQLEAIFRRVDELRPLVTPAEPLSKALTYLVNQHEALLRYTTDGRLEIDNNTAENAIRPLALGRNNWLFAGSPRGGRATALYLSLVESCRRVDREPWRYLRDLFSCVMSHPVSRLRELLPDRMPASGIPP
jgi:transposase